MTNHHVHGVQDDGAPARLGALETRVMEILWQGDLHAIRDIIDRLDSRPAYTTIATVLSNLRKKGLVCTKKEGYATKYRACISREQHTTRVIEHALDESGDRQASILHFITSMTDDDINLLRDFLSREDNPA